MNTTTAYGTRSDCTRDNRATHLPNASTIGYGLWKAKRGNWIHYESDGFHHVARVVGRVHCEGKTYLEVITTDTALSMAYVRWIEPAQVRVCYEGPIYQVIEFLTGDWTDPDKILRRQAQGFSRAPGAKKGS